MFFERFRNWVRRFTQKGQTTPVEGEETPISGSHLSPSENYGDKVNLEELVQTEPLVVKPSDPEGEIEHFTIISMAFIPETPFIPFYDIICCSTIKNHTTWEQLKQELMENAVMITSQLAVDFYKMNYELEEEDLFELHPKCDVIAIFRGRLIDVCGNKVRVN